MVSDMHTLPVFFTTQTPYPLPSQKFMIPASWKRYQLSQLINKALSLVQPVPFDFLVQGEVLRTSLAEWCNEKGVGLEDTLEIEYIESLLPPQHVSNIPHDDWVSSVSCQIPGRFITASYDSLMRIIDPSKNVLHTIQGHTAPVTAICIAGRATTEAFADAHLLASASHDTTARLTALPADITTTLASTTQSLSLASLHLHTAPIADIAASPSGVQLLTAGWDTLVGLWDTRIPEEDEAGVSVGIATGRERKKRRKALVDGANEGIEGVEEKDRAKRKAPRAVLKSHTSRVMGVSFANNEESKAFSCALDSTVRAWDVETGICLYTMTAPEKPFLSLTPLRDPHLLAASSTDRTVTIYDTRCFERSTSTSLGGIAAPQVASLPHSATPSCLVAAPTQAHLLASGAYDGVVRVWDVRSVRGAVSSFRASADVGESGDAKAQRGDGKILGLDWARGVLAVGGEAGLDVWRVPEMKSG